MRQPSHAPARPPVSAPRPGRSTPERPRGVHALSRKTWDKVRTAIRALAEDSARRPRPSPAQP